MRIDQLVGKELLERRRIALQNGWDPLVLDPQNLILRRLLYGLSNRPGRSDRKQKNQDAFHGAILSIMIGTGVQRKSVDHNRLGLISAVSLAQVCRWHLSIVGENNEPALPRCLWNPFFLILERDEGVEVESHDPREG